MKLKFSHLLGAAAAVMALAAGSAQARDVYWNVGIDAAPGVSIGVGNHRPVYVAPAPVYYPAPVYVAQPRYYVQPAPVYYQPAPVYYGPRHRHGPRHGQRHGHGYRHHR